MINVPPACGRSRSGWRSLVTLALASSASAAAAQDAALTTTDEAAAIVPAASPAPAAPDGVITFTPAEFARYAPRSALDMVQRIPDFTLIDPDGDRGLGQASGNVLINGQRVSGKSNDARSVLGSIAASAVVRIEVSDGARLNIPGLSGRVANVVVSGDRLAVQFRWDAQQRRNVADQITTGSIAVSGRVGASDISLSLSNADGLRRGGVGHELATAPDGALLWSRDERAAFHADYPRLAGTLRRLWSDGTILNLNLSGAHYIYDAHTDGRTVDAATGGVTTDRFESREREWGFEGGGDIEFALGGGRLKLIALQSFEHSPVTNSFVEWVGAATTPAYASRFLRTADEGESVLRAEYGWRGGDADWQVAIEGAYNFLDNRSAFERLESDGLFRAVPLPGDNVFVDEWRSEALLTRGWALRPGLTVQATLGAEYSRLRQTGVHELTRSFVRPKGSLTLAWTVNPRLTVNAAFRREVGQLSFFDFTAAADLEDGNVNAGNAQLVPEQRWRVQGEVVQSLGALGSITVGAYHEWISDIVDRIPLSPTQEGVGNLPAARRWGLTFSGTLTLDSIGWSGARLNLSGDLRRSRVRDPLTGTSRRISDELVREISMDFRHDIPRTDLAWGAELYEERYSPVFRLDQVSSGWLTQPITTIFVEHKDVLGLTVRVALRNVLDGEDDLRRDLYVDRRDGPLQQRERQLRRIHPIGLLSISGNF